MFTLVAEALGKCCQNFGTLALVKRRENAAQVLIFILWLGHSLEHSHVPHITSKSTKKSAKNSHKMILGVALGTPGLAPGGLLGTTWGADAKNHQKSDLVDPPQGVLFVSIFTFFGKKSVLNRLFRRVVF